MLNLLKSLSKTTCYVVLFAVLLTSTTVSPGFVQAAPAPIAKLKLVIGDVTANIGQTVDIPVSLNNPAQGVASYNVQLDYNPASLEVQSVTPKYGEAAPAGLTGPTGYFESNFSNAEGWARAIWVDNTGGDHLITQTRELFVIRAKIKGTAGSLTVDSTNPEHLNMTGPDESVSYPVEVTGGKVSLVQSGGTSSQGGSTGTPAPTPATVTESVRVVLDGKDKENMATAEIGTVNGRKVTTVNIDNDTVIRLIASGALKTLMLPVSGDSKEVIGVLNGQLVKDMERNTATLEIQTDLASYMLPASQVGIDDISAQIGSEVALKDILISVKIAETPTAETEQIKTKAAAGQMTLVGNPVNFEVEADYNGKKVSVTRFTDYVERSIALPEGVDVDKITTGIVVDQKGNISHVPTRVTLINGRYYAVINSLTNSTYSVVWNSKTFTDTTKHWGKAEIENLASRLVISGVDSNHFAPDRQITRAEFVSILLRSLGLHSSRSELMSANFSDINDNAWYRDAVLTAVSYDLVDGYPDGTFKPNSPLTRTEAIAILNRAMELTHLSTVREANEADQQLAAYKDHANVAAWAKLAFASAIRNDLVEGTEGQLLPSEAITRAQTAVIVNRLLIKSGLINE